MSAPREMYFFFGAANPLSNWHMADFTVRGITFCCNEQFMMLCKAKLFGDEEIAKKIMLTQDPREHKRLGRQVRKFNGALWNAKRESYVYQGALAKFQQNPHLTEFLMSHYGKELVEASKYDNIWGCGLAEDNPCIKYKRMWPGLNLLGPVLERVQDTLYQQSQK